MGLGAIIGAGIFVLMGVGAREYAGPALALSFILAGIGCGFAALCYAEFASIIAVEGSAYAYAYASIGELFAWLVGWNLILEYTMAASAIATGWSAYFNKLINLFNIKFPIWLMNDVFTAKAKLGDAVVSGTLSQLFHSYSDLNLPVIFGHALAFNFPAFLIIWILTAILIKGIKETSHVNAVMVIVKLSVIIFIIVMGAHYIDVANWQPFIPARTVIVGANGVSRGAYGFLGILSGAAFIFFAFIGFDTVSTQAGEAKNPKKDISFGIIVSLAICAILYALVALVITGMVSYKTIDITAPIAAAFGAKGLGFSVLIISIAAVAGLTSTLIMMLLAQSRVFYAISKDGLIPKKPFGILHPKFRTPYFGSLYLAVIVSAVAGLFPIAIIAELVNIGTLFAFVMVCIGVWYLRYTEPRRKRPFKVPYIHIIAPAGIIFNMAMMLSLSMLTWIRLLIWLVIGFLIYFLYGKKHSKLN